MGMWKHWRVARVPVGLSVGMLSLLALWLVFGSAAEAEEAVQSQRVFVFPSSGVTFEAEFEGARLSNCRLESNGEYRIVIRPENEPVNNSAWYAFRVWAETPQTVAIHLTYEGGTHRYHRETAPPSLSY